MGAFPNFDILFAHKHFQVLEQILESETKGQLFFFYSQ